jgi:hypothetical protein
VPLYRLGREDEPALVLADEASPAALCDMVHSPSAVVGRPCGQAMTFVRSLAAAIDSCTFERRERSLQPPGSDVECEGLAGRKERNDG